MIIDMVSDSHMYLTCGLQVKDSLTVVLKIYMHGAARDREQPEPCISTRL